MGVEGEAKTSWAPRSRGQQEERLLGSGGAELGGWDSTYWLRSWVHGWMER